MKQKILTLQTLYREGQIRLKDSGIEEYQLDAWYLLEYVTGISKASYYGDPNRELSAAQAEEYRKCIEKRSERIPLQHITGVQEFMGHEFFVNEHVLIPRQDTEILVEHALDKVEDGKKVLPCAVEIHADQLAPCVEDRRSGVAARGVVRSEEADGHRRARETAARLYRRRKSTAFPPALLRWKRRCTKR